MPFVDDDGTNEEEEDPFSGLDGLPSTATAPAIRLASPDGQVVASTAAGSSSAPAGSGSAVDATPAEEPEPSTDDAAALDSIEPADVADESDLPLWMRQAHATVIGDATSPLEDLDLDPRLVGALAAMGVRRCFPVQSTVVPRVLAAQACGCGGDVLVSAPTGSGKTLAFALPVVQQLLGRVVPRLRALVLLPTRGLAVQVHKVFAALCKPTPLRVGLAVGQEGLPFEVERALLLGPPPPPGQPAPPGGRSAVDILVATPGRLVELLLAGGGFTLQHLRWLVVDEADRLLQPGYHGWLQQVLLAAHAPPPPRASSAALAACDAPFGQSTARPWLGSMAGAARGAPLRDLGAAPPPPLVKMLFSATLTRNPSKLAPLQLRRPTYFCVAGARRAAPATLREWMVRAPMQEKPLLLALLLRRLLEAARRGTGELRSAEEEGEEGEGEGEGESEDEEEDAAAAAEEEGGGDEAGEAVGGGGGGGVAPKPPPARLPQTLVFSSSLESTHRLARLLQLLRLDAAEFSSAVPPRQRRAVLQRLKAGEARLVVASDALARGMDVDGVEVVVNYEPPSSFNGYLHRVGRTARAGRAGTSFTLLREEEEVDFRQLLAEAGAPYRAFELGGQGRRLRRLRPEYDLALERLSALLALEAAGRLAPLAPIPTEIWQLGEEAGEEEEEEGEGERGDGGDATAQPSRSGATGAAGVAGGEEVSLKKRRDDGTRGGQRADAKARKVEARAAAAGAALRAADGASRAAAAAAREEGEWRRVLAAQLKARVQARRREQQQQRTGP